MATKSKSPKTVTSHDDTKIRKLRGRSAEMVRLAIQKREEARQMLKEAEQIETELLDVLPHNTPLVLPDGTVFSVKDNFAEKNTVWKSTPFARYRFDVIEGR